MPVATGNANESLLALVGGTFVTLRVPYPMGFFAKGRRGVWTTFGNRTPFHLEGGKGTTPKVVKFQLRPDPLAR